MRSRDNKYRAFQDLKRQAQKEKREQQRRRTKAIYLLSSLLFIFFVAGLYIGLDPSRNYQHTVTKDLSVKENILSASENVKEKILKPSAKVDAPLISQLPELPRGCEVTSLAMLLGHAGVEVDKMTLAEEIKKDTTSYTVSGGIIYFGNPYAGFVGNMYDRSKPGFAVFHGPIAELAEEYLPGRIIDMTGSDFRDILYPISDGISVWVMVNTYYRKLEDKYFEVWETPAGPVQITYKTHSVLLTGYDETYIYFNDPLLSKKNRKVNRHAFEECWKQMGRQAITYEPDPR